MNQKYKQNIFHATVNVNLMVQNVIEIKSELNKCFDVRVKRQGNITCAKKIIFGVQVHVLERSKYL